jgi:hypothetical protein
MARGSCGLILYVCGVGGMSLFWLWPFPTLIHAHPSIDGLCVCDFLDLLVECILTRC